MKKITDGMILAGLALLGAIAVYAQTQVMNPVISTTGVVNGTPTVIMPTYGGQLRVSYVKLENRGPGVMIYDFVNTMVQSNLFINGSTITSYCGGVLNPLDVYELPAGKEFQGPISAVCTNGTNSYSLTVGIGGS